MALLPARNILDGTALPVTSQMKAALGSLRDYLAGLLGTDSADTAAARTALGAATRGANTDITRLTGLTTPLSMAQGGTGMVNGFVSSLFANGYQKLPSGLIMQWGTAMAGNGVPATSSLTIAFPNAGLVAFAVHDGGGNVNSYVSAVTLSATQITINNLNAGVIPNKYLAIGF